MQTANPPLAPPLHPQGVRHWVPALHATLPLTGGAVAVKLVVASSCSSSLVMPHKGVLLRYIERITSLSRTRRQVSRLVQKYHRDGKLSMRQGALKHGFICRFTGADGHIAYTLSGLATSKPQMRMSPLILVKSMGSGCSQ